MITAIITAVQQDENLMTLLRLLISNNLPNAPTPVLQAAMAALGLPTS